MGNNNSCMKRPFGFSATMFAVSLFICIRCLSADTLKLYSPSGKIAVKVWMVKQLTYQVAFEGRTIVEPSFVDLELSGNRSLSSDNRIKSASVKKVKSQIISPVPEKRRTIDDNYHSLVIKFRQPYTVEFRAYDDGVAYRISTSFRDSIIVNNEVAEFHFPGQPSAYFPDISSKDNEDPFHSSFEHLFTYKKITDFSPSSIAYAPILIMPEVGPKLAILESDLESYPGMFVKGTGASSLKAVFAAYPAEEKLVPGEFPQLKVSRREKYIARTSGTRNFPWRVLIIAEHDKDLPSNDIVYRLAPPSKIGDLSWISPGNITDEWIIDVNLFNVPFRAGRNTASYKYYIDFASKFGIDRIMLDAGWSDNNDLLKINPDISMDTLVAYAKEKGVKLAMWTLAYTLDRQLQPALEQFNKWGVDFIMTDFIDRDDQKAVDFHHRIAKACAEHKIMLMFHGSFPPKGFNRTYPNAVTREAVLGSEYNIWSDKVSPGHDVLLPFTRMLAGSLDYEPGLLKNATKKSFRAIEGHVMSPGTRSHQLAMLAVYDSPVQFFSGNPSQGLMEGEYMQYLGSVPTTWDETVILDAKVGEYIVTARKSGDTWYVGGMTDWTPRDIRLDFNFLGEGNYEGVVCRDGINADRYAADYILEKTSVKSDNEQMIHMAPGGGFLMRIQKQ